MKKILLGITGSVAAKLTPKLIQLLLSSDYEVKIIMTQSSQYFWNLAQAPVPIVNDSAEWTGQTYQKDQPILHIELRDWADIFLIAPLTANTLAKLANGICDNLITSVARAWITEKPMIVAPAMNTQMWKNPLTKKHLANLSEYYQAIIIPPIEKKLACGEEGLGAMAELPDILNILTDIINKK